MRLWFSLDFFGRDAGIRTRRLASVSGPIRSLSESLSVPVLCPNRWNLTGLGSHPSDLIAWKECSEEPEVTVGNG